MSQRGTTSVSTYPADGEIFGLTLDGDAAENQPLEMLRRYRYNPEGWKYGGKKVTGKQTRQFKLVSVGGSQSFEELSRKLKKEGDVPEGQWREAFKMAYPNPDGKGPIGIADPSWLSPSGSADFPGVRTGGDSGFSWTDRGFNDDWRWLVLMRK